MPAIAEKIPGVVLVAVLATLLVILGQFIEFSATIAAISLGFVLANLIRIPKRFNAGIKWTESKALAIAVALLGVQLKLVVLLQINPISLAVITASILLVFVFTILLAKSLHLNSIESCLVASGQAICGSAAIMAAAKVIETSTPNITHSKQSKETVPVGLIIAVVNFLGFLGVFLSPWLVSQFSQNDDIAGGFLIGNTLQSMGHVVAAGFSVNDAVGQNAVLIKMCRIVYLIPTLMLIIFFVSKQVQKSNTSNQRVQVKAVNFAWYKLIPMFIWVFLALIIFNNLGIIADGVKQALVHVGDVLFILAMIAIGLNIRLQDIWQQGGKLLLLGGVVFSLQIVVTLLALKLI